jgi:hypothetical protein
MNLIYICLFAYNVSEIASTNCPVDPPQSFIQGSTPKWSDWTYSDCSATCGSATKTARRTCIQVKGSRLAMFGF